MKQEEAFLKVKTVFGDKVPKCMENWPTEELIVIYKCGLKRLDIEKSVKIAQDCPDLVNYLDYFVDTVLDLRGLRDL